MKKKTTQQLDMFGVESFPLFSGTAQRVVLSTFAPQRAASEAPALPGMTAAPTVLAADAGTLEAALIGARAVGLRVVVLGQFLLSDEPRDDVQRAALRAVAAAVKAASGGAEVHQATRGK